MNKKLNLAGLAYRVAWQAITEMDMYLSDNHYKTKGQKQHIQDYINDFKYYDKLMDKNPELILRVFCDEVKETEKEIQQALFDITSIENAPKEKEDIWDEYNYR